MTEITNVSGIKITDKGDHFVLEIEGDPHYTLQKRVGIASHLQLPPDDIMPQSAPTSWIQVLKTEDGGHTWLHANSVSVGHPERVIELIQNQLDLANLPSDCYSEHDAEYYDYIEDDDEITENDLPQ